jgi:hypothetical protein
VRLDRTLLHQLWTKAVGAPGYDKDQWNRFEVHLGELERADNEAHAAMKHVAERSNSSEDFYDGLAENILTAANR